MSNRDILAIGTSAGGVDALRFLASELPGDFPASVLVVIHLSAHFESSLDAILTQAGPLPAHFAADDMTMEPGRIYIGPPDSHMLTDGDKLRLGQGPRENNTRPAIDPLFRSVALCCGHRGVGVVLTGTLGDGASGLHILHEYGGLTVVQDPGDAAFSGMPEAALTQFKPDHVTSLAGMPALFRRLVNQPQGNPIPPSSDLVYEVDLAKGGTGSMSQMDRIGERSLLACPDCHGVMWEIKEGNLLRYRCHVGHAYTAELMSLALDENLRRALDSGLRALDERIALAQKLYKQAEHAGRTHLAESWRRKLVECEREAEVLRDSIKRFDQLAAHAVQP
ncbi:protein-glutamate methylesterase [Bradyrhizobium jicamae]|uniref:protein-glutamate methylesterase n=1 Tax=Bradyrhizobium jicamae TaxID=280332 RepID=A0A0R3LRW6_9BRAD|nr:chemotaxis protein CheB [Bradyrhizobium jicamae]KRR10649.1 protein-glutamate methylesterase [Bradyrhizobium jicamae]